MKMLAKALSLFLYTCFAVEAFTAIPPLSASDRIRLSDLIVEGFVADQTVQIVSSDSSFSNFAYTVNLDVQNVVKGDYDHPQISFEYWRPRSRPQGFVGHQGQNNITEINTYIRAYLKIDPDGTYKLLEPNGFEVL